MKTLLTVIVAVAFAGFAAQAQDEQQDKTAWEKTKEAARDAGHAVAKTTKNAANAVVETLTPDKDAHHVNVRLTGDSIDMPKSVPAGKTAFVVKNTATEKQNFEIQGEDIDRGFVFALGPDETKTLQTTLKRGKYKAYAIRKNGEEKRFEINLTVE
jgi:iron uptake system EfeUOB component EfeO/EfeM